MMPKKRILKTQKTINKALNLKIYTTIVSLLVSLIAAEIILRCIGPEYYQFNNQSAEYYTNPRGYHIPLRKEGNHTIYGLRYGTDKQGYRTDFSDNNTTELPAQVSILGLGDSFTFGRGVKYNDIYLTKLRHTLNSDSIKYAVKNCALVGANIDKILDVYKHQSSKDNYSLVLYGFVLNDFGLPGKEQIVGSDFIDFNNGQYTFNPLRRSSRIYNLFCYLSELHRINKITVNAYLNAFQGENAENGFRKLEKLKNMAEAKNSKLIIILFPLLYKFEHYPFTSIHEKIKNFCQQQDIILLDLFPAFSKYKAQQLWVNPTDHHPNELAHAIAAKELFLFLNSQGIFNSHK